MKVLIIGGVAGGATAAARARRENENADILVIEQGPDVSFANCGLPYYIGGEIKTRSALLLQTPQSFWDRYRIKILINTEALSIDRSSKTVKVRGPEGENHLLYDKLIISQGANPIIPTIPGSEAPFVFSLRNLGDMDRINHYIESENPKSGN